MKSLTSGQKKILIIASEFPPNAGGIGNHAYNLALYLSKENLRVTVIADSVGIDKAELKKFQASLPFLYVATTRKKIVFFTYAERIIKATRFAAGKDFIICSGKFSLWLITWMKLFYPSKKYMAVVHGSELDLKNKSAKRLVNYSIKKFNIIIAVSNYTKSFLPTPMLSKTKVISNGVNNDEFNSFVNNNFESGENDKLSIITVGSVSERKGQENVIRAMPALVQLFPNIHYHIIGKPVIQSRLEQLAQSFSVENNISFHGMLERSAMINLLRKSAVAFLLSNHTGDGDFEGFGIVVLEANALGKPAIGSKQGGIADAIKDGVTGKIVDPKDANAISKALQEILLDYQRYSENALQWARQHDWKIIIQKYTDVLKEI